MIPVYYKRDIEIPLIDTLKLIPEKNIFSILVGKNGTGKSTLLGSLCEDLIKEIARRKKHQSEEFDFKELTYSPERSDNFFPSEIIAVSTSPFDKFPINRFNRQRNYTYLGLRDINSLSIGLGYLSKIIASLIESIFINNRQASEICNVLEFLGYRDEINIILDYSIIPRNFDQILSVENLTKEFDDRSSSIFRKVNRQFFTNADNSLNERKFKKLIKILHSIYEERYDYRYYDLRITRYGFETLTKGDEIETLIFLFEAGLIKLKDVLLTKIENYERYSIKQASSGEQSIILGILGIASKIKDRCIVLIDEPEICLHPQWQETYINILTQTFDKYKDCQFIIATHSPLIISRLSNYNSFIIDMETFRINSAENFINNSVDFQLANVFNHPGFKNEYLLRLAMNVFSNISRNKKFTNQDYEYFKILDEQAKHLRNDDPVFDLYKTIVELRKIYG